jgi:hypothetical protein
MRLSTFQNFAIRLGLSGVAMHSVLGEPAASTQLANYSS